MYSSRLEHLRKNTSNEAIGGFGIGAKAPSAYASSWVVESRFQGKHSVYNTSLNGSKRYYRTPF